MARTPTAEDWRNHESSKIMDAARAKWAGKKPASTGGKLSTSRGSMGRGAGSVGQNRVSRLEAYRSDLENNRSVRTSVSKNDHSNLVTTKRRGR